MSKYNEVMERISLSETDYEHIMAGIEGSLKREKGRKIRSVVIKTVPIFAVAAAGVILGINLRTSNITPQVDNQVITSQADDQAIIPQEDDHPIVGGDGNTKDMADDSDESEGNYVTFADSDELSKYFGFEIRDIEGIDLGDCSITYSDNYGTAEIYYSRGTDDFTLTYRKSPGVLCNALYVPQENFSERQLQADAYSLDIVEAWEENVQVIWWNDGEYSYSLMSTPYLTDEEICDIIKKTSW